MKKTSRRYYSSIIDVPYILYHGDKIDMTADPRRCNDLVERDLTPDNKVDNP